MLVRILGLVCISSILVSCVAKKATMTKETLAIEELYAMMQGSFSSGEQAEQDSDFYDISLHMYPIWEDKSGNWLYVEQAVTSMQDKPYRQRVYELIALPDGRIESKVYTLNEPEKYIFSWQKEGFWQDKEKSILTEREGCSVFLERKSKGFYSGSTDGKACLSTLRGASYASSIVDVKDGKIESWDQGWNEDGEQVWGATKSGYIFKKN